MDNLPAETLFEYPKIRSDESHDPYRWMEDPTSPELAEFITQENELFSKYVESCPDGDEIHRRLTDLSGYEKYSNACKKGEKYYFFMNSVKQHNHDQDCLYVQDNLKDQPRIFIDPNSIPGIEDSEQKQIRIYSFSTNGELIAYGLSIQNSDWLTIRFKSAATGEDFPDNLHRVKESDIAWLPNGKGILYSCHPPGCEDTEKGSGKDQSHALLYHALGTDQTQDVIIADFKEYSFWLIQAQVSDCGEFVIATAMQDQGENLLFYSKLPNKDYEEEIFLRPLLTKFNAYFEYITNIGKTMYLRTNKGAKNYRIITINTDDPDTDLSWKVLIGEHPRNALDWVDCVNKEYLLVCYIRDVKHSLQLRRLDDGVLLYTFPVGIGTIADHFGDKNCSEFFFTFTSFLIPDKIFHVDLSGFQQSKDNKWDPWVRRALGCFWPKPIRLRVFKEVELPFFNPKEFISKQVFYESLDGTQIPLFIVHKKKLKMDGKAPCLLYGYGGFGGFIVPSFSISRIPFIQNFDGVFALASIRGGGEYGQNWYDAGRLWGKQVSVEDLIAAAEYLLISKYTIPSKLVLEGRRNGGLVAAACVNQRPELFGAAIINEGILDLIRFHHFGVGKWWLSDYGDPDNDSDWIYDISPLHNIEMRSDQNCQYPSLLVVTGKSNNEVAPQHSYKYIATLQQELGLNIKQTNPLMIRVDMNYQEGVSNPDNISHLVNLNHNFLY